MLAVAAAFLLVAGQLVLGAERVVVGFGTTSPPIRMLHTHAREHPQTKTVACYQTHTYTLESTVQTPAGDLLTAKKHWFVSEQLDAAAASASQSGVFSWHSWTLSHVQYCYQTL